MFHLLMQFFNAYPLPQFVSFGRVKHSKVLSNKRYRSDKGILCPLILLFFACMERLSQMISIVVDNQLWKYIQLGKNGPKVSHVAFANDLFLFAEASVDQVEVTTTCLDFFAVA